MLDTQSNRGGGQQMQTDLHALLPSDTFGYELIARRISAIETLLPSNLFREIPAVNLPIGPVSVTGIGSSRASAEYFASLLNTIPGMDARFFDVPWNSKIETKGPIVLFSQGLSANTDAIVRKQIAEGCGIVFTAATPQGAHEAGNARVEKTLAALAQSGVTTIPMPLEGEYQVLMRTIGPWFSYLAAYRVAQQLSPTHFEWVSGLALSEMFPRAESKAAAILAQVDRAHLDLGVHFVVLADPTYVRNLGDKWVEGAFLHRPHVSSAIEFDHGPFQLISRRGGTVFLFRSGFAAEAPIVESIRAGLALPGDGVRKEFIDIYSPLPAMLRPLEYEMIFNHLTLGLMRQGGKLCQQNQFQEGLNYSRVMTFENPSQ